MRNLQKIILRALCCFLPVCNFAFAQDTDKYDTLYDRERFSAADADYDGLLDKEEIRHAAVDFEYYLPKAVFMSADTDRDGHLSFKEIAAKRAEEKADIRERDRQMLHGIKRDIGEKDAQNYLQDINWLKRNPGVVRDLFTNQSWLEQYPDALIGLAGDKEWMSRYPDSTETLYQNRRFLTFRPDIAARLYENTELLNRRPELAERVFRYRDWMVNNR